MIFCVQRITKDCLGYESRVSACFFLKRFGACLVGLFVFDVFVWFGLVGVFFVFLFLFLNEESLLSAEQLLKQWIMVYFCGI